MTAICSVGLDMIAIPEDTLKPLRLWLQMRLQLTINMKTTAVRNHSKGKEGDMIDLEAIRTAPVAKVNGASLLISSLAEDKSSTNS